MREIILGNVILAAATALAADPDIDHVKTLLKSEDYTVTWGTPATYPREAELEIDNGSGHGFTLNWLRFRPGKDAVEVLAVEFKEERKQYRSTWPPDRAPVTVRLAQMKPDIYAALLRDLAVVDAATLKPVVRNSILKSSRDFWVYERLTADKKTLIDLEWAGYASSREELNYARPQAATILAREAIKGLDFKDHALTEADRAWASAKFGRDWKTIKDADFHWWVRERYIVTIGIVGDATALPTLRDILAAEPPKEKSQRASDDRIVYHAINAVTRLTKKDVRDKPVEEMDLEKSRRAVLELLRDKK